MSQMYQRPYAVAIPLTAGTDIPRQGQVGIFIACTVAGNVVLKLPIGTLTVPVLVGPNIIDNIEVIGIITAGTTATATYTALAL
jgi:hypothetical protein